ncbi:hypothetical protein ACSDR0_50905, partial [Streptosporangium sp. G11]|uniref:hypothetical protein n=1 Tax=Streptosporangium sp. G11 TaxID=3436926 RepID=UPI003EB7DA71
LIALGVPSAAWAADPVRPAWQRHTVDSSISGAEGVRLGDVNGDGDLDAFATEERLPRAGLSTSPGLIWYENPTRRPPHRAR